jgi:cytochrome c oxidase subunit III
MRVLDVSGLPTYAFGHRGLMWWGTMGLVLIESVVFAAAIASYFYLWLHNADWPPAGEPPALLYGTLNTIILLASGLPNHLTKKAAEHEDLRKVRIGLVFCLLFALAFLAVRAFEFTALNTSWYDHAYGSILYALLVLHTAHLVTDAVDTGVLTALMFKSELVEGRRFVDVAENALYWWFVVAAWLPIYFTVYIAPRVLAH